MITRSPVPKLAARDSNKLAGILCRRFKCKQIAMPLRSNYQWHRLPSNQLELHIILRWNYVLIWWKQIYYDNNLIIWHMRALQQRGTNTWLKQDKKRPSLRNPADSVIMDAFRDGNMALENLKRHTCRYVYLYIYIYIYTYIYIYYFEIAYAIL